MIIFTETKSSNIKINYIAPSSELKSLAERSKHLENAVIAHAKELVHDKDTEISYIEVYLSNDKKGNYELKYRISEINGKVLVDKPRPLPTVLAKQLDKEFGEVKIDLSDIEDVCRFSSPKAGRETGVDLYTFVSHPEVKEEIVNLIKNGVVRVQKLYGRVFNTVHAVDIIIDTFKPEFSVVGVDFGGVSVHGDALGKPHFFPVSKEIIEDSKK